MWSETLAVTQLHTINVYNQMFLIDDKNVLSVVLNPDSIDKIQIVNELNLASSQDSIKFTKVGYRIIFYRYVLFANMLS